MNKIKHPFITFMKFAHTSYKKYFHIALMNCVIKALEIIYDAYAISILLSYLEKGNYQSSLICGGIIVFINFVFYFLNKFEYRLDEIESMKLENNMEFLVAKKLMEVSYTNLEDPEFLELKTKSQVGKSTFGGITLLVSYFIKVVENILVLIGLGTILITFDYRLIIIMVVAIILDTLFICLTLKAQIKFYQDLIPCNRKFGYFLNAIFDYKNAKDFRMYKQIGDMMQENYINNEHQSMKEFKKFYTKQALSEAAQKIVAYGVLMLAYIIILTKVINNSLSVSSFSLYVTSAVSFTTAMVALIHASLDIISMTQYIVPTLELLNAKVDDTSGKKEFTQPIESIEFDHVCFKYPRNDDLILDDISFKINQGEKISLVGLNGAGKTTIVKLITRLYQPTSGRILINGEDIAQYEFNSYIKHISSVFQDFKLFAYSLKENILNADGDDKVAYDIACKVGLKEKIDSLPEGINSLYTKSYEENGIELSGGEAQKIAIARCINASSELVILDEPTSALDPLSEASIYENFNDLVQNKTALYISHRMSSSIFCDKIMVLDHGKIVDYDTHENLMKKKDGLYYRLFHEQAKNYAS